MSEQQTIQFFSKKHSNYFMKKISRQQAEEIFLHSEVLHTQIKQDKNELRVIMSLSTNQLCHVTYNYKSKEKSYHLDQHGNIKSPSPSLR